MPSKIQKKQDPDEKRRRDVGRVTSTGHVRKGRTRAQFFAEMRNDPSPEIVDKICELVATGLPRPAVREAAGVSPRVFSRWVKTGRKHQKDMDKDPELEANIYSELVRRMDIADGKIHGKLVAKVIDSDDPKVIKDFVFRRWASMYQTDPTKIINEETAEVEQIDTATLLTEKLKNLFHTDG